MSAVLDPELPIGTAVIANESSTTDRFRILFAGAFWITAGISLLLGMMAIGIVATNLGYVIRTGNSLPNYIYSLFVLVPACAIGFGYSALQWRRRRPRRALIAFAVSSFATFVGPRLLLAILP